MSIYRPELDDTIDRYQAILDGTDPIVGKLLGGVTEALDSLDRYGGISYLEALTDGIDVHPDQRGRLARLVEDIRRHLDP